MNKEGKKKSKVNESDIDGELVSKVSKANLLSGNNQYQGEVHATAMNIQQMEDLDKFLMDNEEEEDGVDFEKFDKLGVDEDTL